MTPFARHIQADGSTLWWQADPGRYVSPQQYQLLEWLTAGGVPDVVPYEAPPAEAPAVRQYGKLAIVRALIGAGLFDAFAAWLDSDRRLRAQWDAANVLASDDPVFGQALPQFAAAFGLNAEQIAALLAACEVTT